MTRNDKIAIRCLSLALGCIVIVCWLENPRALGAVDQGWATLLAAFLGFWALAHQTRVGFRNLRVSAIEQSQADRAAREHQADIDRRAELKRTERAIAVLAAALDAELNSARNQVNLRIKILRGQREFYEKHSGAKSDIISVSELIPSSEAVVYHNNASNLGLLGPALAYQVVDIYTKLHFRPIGKIDKLVGKQVAETLKNFEEFYESWLEHHSMLHAELIKLSSPDDVE